MNQIDKTRAEIERIDEQMAVLFEQRMRCSKEVALYKQERGIPILDREREQKLIEKNSKYIQNKDIETYYREFLTDVMDVSKKYQHRILEGTRVAYSGIEGSFAAISVSRLFPDAERVSCKTFADAYDAVEKGECDLAVLPIENSYAGEVTQVSDLMFGGNLYINGVYELGVSQCLLGVKGSSVDCIKRVISHPQALEQCSAFIHDHKLQSIVADNTARAAKQVADMADPTTAAIASRETAELYDLSVLDHDINGSAQNTTRFAVFSKTNANTKSSDRHNTFILMFTVGNGAGTLARAISVLGEYGYSMKVIRSRPIKSKNWQYYFYAEVEGKINSEKGTQMINDLKKECDVVKVVGTYKPEARI